MLTCDKCAARAAVYRDRALLSLPYARRALDEIRRRLRHAPPEAVFLAAGGIPADLTDYSLELPDLSRILALGQAIASMPSRDREGFWLSVRGSVEQGGEPHHFVLVIHYLWPAPSAPSRWPLLLSRVIELGPWHDADGFPLCWCDQTKEQLDAV